jgi:chromatin remodeling complex protein RSC6
MMNAKTTDSSAKKVAKKASASTPVVAAPAPVVASPSEPVKKVVKKSSASASAAPNAAPVAVPAPAVTSTDALVVESSLADEIAALQTQLTAIRDGAAAALVSLKRVAKRASQEVKEARKNRKRSRTEPADGEPRKPSNFEIPVPISDELSSFLGGGKANSMSRAQVTKAINAYVNEKKLRVKHDITPDAALRKLLSVDDSVKLTIFNMQTYLGRHYLKPAAKATA